MAHPTLTQRERAAGFSLVELMVVLGVIAILAGLGAHSATSAAEESRATVCEKNRALIEEEEKLFFHHEGRLSESLDELVDEGYVSRVTCPRGGILTWEITDSSDPFAHQSLVCSIHGRKTRIEGWEKPAEESTSTVASLGAGFESGSFGAWATLGAASIVTSAFGASYDGEHLAYLDTNSSPSKVIGRGKLAKFLGVSSKALNELGPTKYTGGTAIKLEVDDAGLDALRFNFLTSEWTPTYWYNDAAFMTVSNASTGRQDVYLLADTYSAMQSSGTKFKEETGWLSLSDVGLDVDLQPGDVVGFGVMNSTDKIISSAILLDEGK